MFYAETLLPLIQKWIGPGTYMHDGWGAYNDIHLLPEHYPQHNIHTQGIESRWNVTKASIPRMYWTSEHLFETYCGVHTSNILHLRPYFCRVDHRVVRGLKTDTKTVIFITTNLIKRYLMVFKYTFKPPLHPYTSI